MNQKNPNELADLGVLASFLKVFNAGVEPRAREALSSEEQDLLLRLAAGELEASSRSDLIPLLARNELAMEFLAAEVGGGGLGGVRE